MHIQNVSVVILTINEQQMCILYAFKIQKKVANTTLNDTGNMAAEDTPKE